MPTESITEKPNPAPGHLGTPREVAPSILREDEPSAVRFIALLGTVLCLTPGTVALFMHFYSQQSRLIGLGWGTLLVTVGVMTLLWHAASDRDEQIRRAYGMLGLTALGLGAVASLIPMQGGPVGVLFLPGGFLMMLTGLLFLMAFVRNEAEEAWRVRALSALGLAGTAMALVGVVAGNLASDFFVPKGMALALLGLAYLGTFVVARGIETDAGYRAALAVGLLGLVTALVAAGRSALVADYFYESGFLLLATGLLYFGASLALCSDSPVVVMARRELAAFFYSPIAYIVLFGLTLMAAVQFFLFVNLLVEESRLGGPIPEPIIRGYIWQLVPVICIIFVVPVLSMRLLSEEKRTGTIEMLLTAPLGETSIVVSKFLAVWVFFLLLWVPWALILIALRAEAGQPFEYRPLLSFFLVLACTGANFLAMGLFFSGLTRNQVAAAVLTFMGMIAFLGLWILSDTELAGKWRPVLAYLSFLDVWRESLQGRLWLRDLAYHVSAAGFWLFVTTRVLEARKWA